MTSETFAISPGISRLPLMRLTSTADACIRTVHSHVWGIDGRLSLKMAIEWGLGWKIWGCRLFNVFNSRWKFPSFLTACSSCTRSPRIHGNIRATCEGTYLGISIALLVYSLCANFQCIHMQFFDQHDKNRQLYCTHFLYKDYLQQHH